MVFTVLSAITISGANTGDSFLRLGYDNEQAEELERRRDLEKERALEKFLSGAEKRSYRIAQIATSNSEDALDIVQDAMFKLVEKYAHKNEDEWPGLFQRILQSRIRDWYRRNTVRNRFRSWLSSFSENAEEQEDPFQKVEDVAGRSPEQLLTSSLHIEALEKALHELPLRQQQAFLLRIWQGLSVRETAKAMNCAEGSVKTHYSRALKVLREKLGEQWYD